MQKAMSNLMEKRSQLENERNQLDLKYKSIEEKIRQLRSKQKSTANTIAVNSEMDDVAFIVRR
jgi:predicted  nucleic acid-binding Zn-ribbon protein